MASKSYTQKVGLPRVWYAQVSTRSGPVLEFTAPGDGTMLFATHNGTRPATSQTVSVTVNGVTAVSFVQSDVSFGQTTSSCIAQVREGDAVQLVVDTVTGSDGNSYLHRAYALYL
jgi:hypothetical protein